MIDLCILEETTGRERHRLFVYKDYIASSTKGLSRCDKTLKLFAGSGYLPAHT